MRITLTEPKAALAGVMLNTSFAIFIASIAAFNKEIAVSGRFGRCDFVAMVETRGGWRKRRGVQAVWDPGPIIWMGGNFVRHRPGPATWGRRQLIGGDRSKLFDQFFVDRPRTMHPDIPVAGSP